MKKTLNLISKVGFGKCYILNLSGTNSHWITVLRIWIEKIQKKNEYLTSPFELYFSSNDVVAKYSQETS